MEAGTVVTAADWASVISAATGQISVATVVAVLATLVAAGIGLVFMWWGVRKAMSSLMKAFRSGRISIQWLLIRKEGFIPSFVFKVSL